MKFKPRDRVMFYDLRGETHRGLVTAATPDEVRVTLWDGRTLRLVDHDGVSRLTRLPRRR